MSVNVKSFREARGWSQEQLATAAGVNRSTVSRIESGERPNPGASTVQKIALALGKKSTDLTGETVFVPVTTYSEHVAAVPIVRYVHASGSPTWRDTGERVYLPESTAGQRSSLLAGIVTGECMSPEVEPGDCVVWDSANRNAQEGDMVVVSHEGDLLVKRAYHDLLGRPMLVANDGQTLRPNGAILEGVVMAIVKRPRRRPLPLS